jgi:hypothetical protein
MSSEQRDKMAVALVEKCGVPAVVVRDGQQRAIAFTAKGRFLLPRDTALVFGEDHPFLPDLGEDLACLVHHPNSGTFVLLGWERGGPAISFANENGSHAGLEPEETHGFMLLPQAAPLPTATQNYYRPSDLREAVLAAFDFGSRQEDLLAQNGEARQTAEQPGHESPVVGPVAQTHQS